MSYGEFKIDPKFNGNHNMLVFIKETDLDGDAEFFIRNYEELHKISIKKELEEIKQLECQCDVISESEYKEEFNELNENSETKYQKFYENYIDDRIESLKRLKHQSQHFYIQGLIALSWEFLSCASLHRELYVLL